MSVSMEKNTVKWLVGELIDLFDPLADVFCPASIVRIRYNKLNYVGDISLVRVHYLGSYAYRRACHWY